jgi:predicted AAA+ superfamily ATPase
VLNTRAATARGPLGGGLENQVAVELARTGVPLCGWKRTPSGGEIDFLLTRKRQTVPVECKASLALDGRFFRGLGDYLQEYDQPLGVIVSFAPYGITEIVPPGSRRKRRIVMLPAPLLERLGAIAEA